MSSRDKILNALPKGIGSDHISPFTSYRDFENRIEKFSQILVSIGGSVIQCDDLVAVNAWIHKQFGEAVKAFSTVEGVLSKVETDTTRSSLAQLQLAVIQAKMGVAENGSVWITDESMPVRLLPFICEHLVVLLSKEAIVSTMHHAYDAIGDSSYKFGVFIAGPSKTADIEQSLVLGAHGPKTMMVILMP